MSPAELQPLRTGPSAAPPGSPRGSTRRIAGFVVVSFVLWLASSVPQMEYTLLNAGMIAVTLAGVVLRLIGSTRALGAGLMWGGLASLALEVFFLASWSVVNLVLFILGGP